MRAARLPDRTQTTAGAIAHRRADRTLLNTPDHRWSLQRRNAWPHGRNTSPEAARGGPLAALRNDDVVTVDVSTRPRFGGVPIYANEIAAAGTRVLVNAILTSQRLNAHPATPNDVPDIDD